MEDALTVMLIVGSLLFAGVAALVMFFSGASEPDDIDTDPPTFV